MEGVLYCISRQVSECAHLFADIKRCDVRELVKPVLHCRNAYTHSFFSHLYIKKLILPRQARDKHKGKLKNRHGTRKHAARSTVSITLLATSGLIKTEQPW
eukprot:COSAG06_NODE_3087_length_5878_cov_75.802042_4_plen_101_part_00